MSWVMRESLGHAPRNVTRQYWTENPGLSPFPARGEGAGSAPSQPRANPSPPAGEGGARSAPGEGASKANGHDRTFASPLARRLAKDAGIEVGRIEGSGPHGRVIARDVEAAKSGQGLAAPAAAIAPAAAMLG